MQYITCHNVETQGKRNATTIVILLCRIIPKPVTEHDDKDSNSSVCFGDLHVMLLIVVIELGGIRPKIGLPNHFFNTISLLISFYSAHQTVTISFIYLSTSPHLTHYAIINLLCADPVA